MDDINKMREKADEFENLVDALGKVSDNYTVVFTKSIDNFKKTDKKKNKIIIGILICLGISIIANFFLAMYTINLVQEYQVVETYDTYDTNDYDIQQHAEGNGANYNNINGSQNINDKERE